MIGYLFLIIVIISFAFNCSFLQYKFSLSRRNSIISTSIFTTALYYIIIECCSLFCVINRPIVVVILLLYSILGVFLWLKIPQSNKFVFFDFRSFLILIRKKYLLAFILFIAFLIFITGCLYPPTTWDSLTYHLPRIEHWIQNQNLNFYDTTVERQLFSAPLAELLVLPIRLLSNSDTLSFSIQWFAYLGSILVISNIARLLSLNSKQQLYACVFFATLPIAILEASSTQNDLVVCFWILCSIDRMIVSLRSRTYIHFFELGLSIGFAILTKGTAYLILAPFILYFAYKSIREYKPLMSKALFVASVILIVNLPHFIRTYQKYDTPIEAYPSTKSNFTVESMFYSMIGNIYINAPIPLTDTSVVNEKLSKVSKDIFPYGSFYVYSTSQFVIWVRHFFTFQEDTAKNPLHLILIFIAILILFFKISKIYNWNRIYLFLSILSFLFFFFGVPWQPWVVRLQIPLFAIFAPLFGLALVCINNKLKNIVLCVICIYALLPTLFNYSRPLKSIGRGIPYLELNTSYKSCFNTKKENLFIYSEINSTKFIDNLDFIVANKPDTIDILVGGDDPEYMIWYYLRNNVKKVPYLRNVKNSSEFRSNLVYILDQNFITRNSENLYMEDNEDIFCVTMQRKNNTYFRVK